MERTFNLCTYPIVFTDSESQTRIQKVDPRWKNEANESAQLLGFVLEHLISASDKSTPPETRRISEMANQQEEDNKKGRTLFSLSSDADSYWSAFIAEGHDSPLTELMFSQVAHESPCGDENCKVVSRNFEMAHIVYLDLPLDPHPQQEFPLQELLANWALTTVSPANGHLCEFERNHAKGLFHYRCFTRTSKYICFAVRRGGVYVGGAQVHELNQVDIPTEIDIS